MSAPNGIVEILIGIVIGFTLLCIVPQNYWWTIVVGGGVLVVFAILLIWFKSRKEVK